MYAAGCEREADFDGDGVGGQTAVFHAASQWEDGGLPMVRLLVEAGADLWLRTKLPGEIVECTPLGYSLLVPRDNERTLKFLRENGGVE